MADNIRFLNITGFVGVNTTASDHYTQPHPRALTGPALMRRLLSIDPFTEAGKFNPANTYALEYDADGSEGIGTRMTGSSLEVYRVGTAGGNQHRLLKLVGGSWLEVSTDADFHFGGRVRFVAGYNAIFAVDGVHRPRVVGWGYDTNAYPMLHYSDDHNIAEILYTKGSKQTPTTEQDDFYAEHACFHAECLVLARDSEVRMSEAYAPLTFWADPVQNATTNERWFWVQEGDGDRITGVKSFQGKMLVVAKGHSLHGYSGTDPAESYSHVVIDASEGLIAPDSWALGENKMWGCGANGPWAFDLSYGVVHIGEAIQAEWDSLTLDEMAQVVGWFENGKYHIVLPRDYDDVSGTVPANAKMRLTFDHNSKQWTQGWGVVGTSCLAAPTEENPYLLTASGGKIWRQNYSADLEGETVIHEVVTPRLEFGDIHRDKWIRRLRIELEQGPDTIQVDHRFNTDEAWISETYPAARGQAVWTSQYEDITNEEHQVEVVEDGVNLAYPFVSDLVVKDSTLTTTFIEGVDYNYDPNTGHIFTFGGIAQYETLHVDYKRRKTSDIPRFYPESDPRHFHWGKGGSFTIDIPVTWHAKTLTLRLRGAGLKVLSIGIGFDYEVV